MDREMVRAMLRSFHDASISTKVLIAGALYGAMKGGNLTEEELNLINKMWAEAVRFQVIVEHIEDLYRKGWADYTSELYKYRDVIAFIVKTMAIVLGREPSK